MLAPHDCQMPPTYREEPYDDSPKSPKFENSSTHLVYRLQLFIMTFAPTIQKNPLKKTGPRPHHRARLSISKNPGKGLCQPIGKSAAMPLDPTQLSLTEVVLLAPDSSAVALAYSPGETPTVVMVMSGPHLSDLLWSAQEIGAPIVECSELSGEILAQLKPGDELPHAMFRPAAQAIALVQRSRPGPVPVRLVKDLDRRPVGLARRSKARLAELTEQLQVSRIWIEIRDRSLVPSVESLTTLHKQKLQSETGLPLLTLQVRHRPDLECDGRILVHGSPEFVWSAGPHADVGDLMLGLYEVISRNAHRLLGFRETEILLEAFRKTHRGLYNALFPEHLTVSGLRQVLRNLLREGIKIRDLAAVLEALEEHKLRSQDPDQLTEFVRASLNFQLCREYADSHGVIHAIFVSPEMESSILKDIHPDSSALWFNLDVDVSLKLLTGVARGVEKGEGRGIKPVLLCSPRPRRFLRRLVEPSFPRLPVMSYPEVAADADVRVYTTLGL